MHKPTPTPSFSEIDAFLLGLVRVLAALGDVIALPRALKQLLRDHVFRAERCAQAVIVLLALKRRPLRAMPRAPLPSRIPPEPHACR